MENVFGAIADPTRRAIIDRLRTDGPLSLSELAAPLPMSRQGVTKHLDALLGCGLVRIERVGRERMHRLDPTPLAKLGDWLAPYALEWDRRLERLRRHLEKEPT